MNMVCMIGNVASDPTIEHTPSGKAICTFRLAVSRPGGDNADFFTVATFERQAEVCAEYLQTGRRVSIEGRLHHSSFEDSNGERRSKVEIVASRVELLGAPGRAAAAAEKVRA
jgi:single-strand DNA-binding protein